MNSGDRDPVLSLNGVIYASLYLVRSLVSECEAKNLTPFIHAGVLCDSFDPRDEESRFARTGPRCNQAMPIEATFNGVLLFSIQLVHANFFAFRYDIRKF